MNKRGFTVVELCVTILIVAILCVLLGGAFVRLLRLHESNREEGYMREKLTFICGEVADHLSMAKSIIAVSNQYGIILKGGFRMEMEGVSYETGKVVKVNGLYLSGTNGTFNVKIDTADDRYNGSIRQTLDADGMLMNVLAKIVEFRIDPPIVYGVTNYFPLHVLTVSATNSYYDIIGNTNAVRRVISKRGVRLWNAN
jgi:hypothetical protein